VPLPRRQSLDRRTHRLVLLVTQQTLKRGGLRAGDLVQRLPTLIVFLGGNKVCQLQSVDAGELLLEIGEREAQVCRKLRFARRAPQGGAQGLPRRLDAACHTPKRTRAPVVGTEAVEYGSADTELRERREAGFAGRVITADGIDEAKHSGADKVCKLDVVRQLGGDATGQDADLRHVAQHHGVEISTSEAGGSERCGVVHDHLHAPIRARLRWFYFPHVRVGLEGD